MKKIVVCFATLAAIMLFASGATADPMAQNDRHIGGPLASIDGVEFHPTFDADPPDEDYPWDWPDPPYTLHEYADPVTGEYPEAWPIETVPIPAIPAGNWMVFGMENLYWPTNIKSVYLVIEYTGGSLDLEQLGWGYAPGSPSQTLGVTYSSPGKLIVVWTIDPQPDYEWLLIKNNGVEPAVITKVYFTDECHPVPSLTQWGIIGLVLLMLAAGAMVIVRRRRAMARA
jgi:hypothetical protein